MAGLPPFPRKAASSRLRFRFVRVVRAARAGMTKLRGRMASPVRVSRCVLLAFRLALAALCEGFYDFVFFSECPSSCFSQKT